MGLIILPDAEAEMIDTANSHEAKLPELGEDFLDEVSACFERILRNPHIGQNGHLGGSVMTKLELTLNLPDELAQNAQAAGLLTPEALEKLLREAIERGKKMETFFATVDRLHAANIPPMTMEEIQAEVDAVRASRRARRDAQRADRS